MTDQPTQPPRSLDVWIPYVTPPRRPSAGSWQWHGPVIGITGTRSIELPRDAELIRKLASYVESCRPSAIVSGACVGFDAFFHRLLFEWLPRSIHHMVIVPSDPSRVDKWWSKVTQDMVTPRHPVTVLQMPPETSYRDRDQRIVDNCDMLVGLALYPENDGHSLRSGTWLTVRLARKAIHHIQAPHVEVINGL